MFCKFKAFLWLKIILDLVETFWSWSRFFNLSRDFFFSLSLYFLILDFCIDGTDKNNWLSRPILSWHADAKIWNFVSNYVIIHYLSLSISNVCLLKLHMFKVWLETKRSKIERTLLAIRSERTSVEINI